MATSANEDRLLDLLVRWDELRRQGRDVSAEELCADCPELGGELGERIEALRGIDPVLDFAGTAVLPNIRNPGSRHAQGRKVPDVMHALAIYRPQRHHARGGLGEVLAARQEELGRMVALKRIRPERLHEAARKRFLREAEITAGLQHPGIVPIYSLGQDDDGPFYTMPLIEGQTLQEAIDEFHGDQILRSRDSGQGSLRFREVTPETHDGLRHRRLCPRP